METGKKEMEEVEKSRTKIIYHMKKIIKLKKIRTKNKIKTMRMKMDSNRRDQ